MEQVLLVVQVIVTLAMIVMVLIQRSDSDGFGLSGGSGNNLLSGRSTANLMTRTTAILAAVFMANALLLGVIAARGHSASIVETIEEQQAEAPSAPAVPVAGETKTEKKSSKKESSKKEAPVVPEADAKPEASKKTAAEMTPKKDAQAKKAEKNTSKKVDNFDPNAPAKSKE